MGGMCVRACVHYYVRESRHECERCQRSWPDIGDLTVYLSRPDCILGRARFPGKHLGWRRYIKSLIDIYGTWKSPLVPWGIVPNILRINIDGRSQDSYEFQSKFCIYFTCLLHNIYRKRGGRGGWEGGGLHRGIAHVLDLRNLSYKLKKSGYFDHLFGSKTYIKA